MDIEEVIVYPNPAQQSISFKIPVADEYNKIILLNSEGKIVSGDFAINASSLTFDISALNDGIYIAKLIGKTGSPIHIKFAIQKN